uniref:Si:ch211-132g1.3 n=1 Tax=Cyprinus carpio TaxID=7962 RepID=A0A8C1JF94_CYPCA
MCHLYNNNKKMSLRCLMLVIICVVFITTEAVSGEEVNVFGEVGGTVSFRPARIDPSVSSIIWKHRSSTGSVAKAIEWDVEDGVSIPNPRFKDITTLDKKTGEITITKFNFEHSGFYTIDINSKEQEQRFTLEVLGERILIIIFITSNTVKALYFYYDIFTKHILQLIILSTFFLNNLCMCVKKYDHF